MLARVAALRHDDGADRVGVPFRLRRAEASAPRHRPPGAPRSPGGDGAPRRSPCPSSSSMSQATSSPRRSCVGGRIGEVAVVVRARSCRRRRRRCAWKPRAPRAPPAPSRHRQDAQAGRQHEAFLEPGDGAVHAPRVLVEFDRGDRRDAVDHQKRRMVGGVERRAHALDVRSDAGRGLVVGGEDRA